MANSMSMKEQVEVKSIPGNDRCVDCPALNPQWASVSYGTLMCLECSGLHRSLGVHISFVRSMTMDSWSEKQLGSMRAGGNEKFRNALRDAGCPASMVCLDCVPETNSKYQNIFSAKYNSNVMEVYRDRVIKVRDGLEPPPLPDYEKPGVGNERGIEPLAGESEEAYVERQAKIRLEAKQRLAARCGGGGMQGIGSSPMPQDSGGIMGQLGFDSKTADAATAALGQGASALMSGFGKLSTSVQSSVGSADVGSKLNSGWSSLRSAASSAAASASKAAADLDAGIGAGGGGGWGSWASSLANKATSATNDLVNSALGEDKGETSFFPRTNTEIEDKTKVTKTASGGGGGDDDWDDWGDTPKTKAKAKTSSPRKSPRGSQGKETKKGSDWDDWDDDLGDEDVADAGGKSSGSAGSALRSAQAAAANKVSSAAGGADDDWDDDWGSDEGGASPKKPSRPARSPTSRSPRSGSGGKKSPAGEVDRVTAAAQQKLQQGLITRDEYDMMVQGAQGMSKSSSASRLRIPSPAGGGSSGGSTAGSPIKKSGSSESISKKSRAGSQGDDFFNDFGVGS